MKRSSPLYSSNTYTQSCAFWIWNYVFHHFNQSTDRKRNGQLMRCRLSKNTITEKTTRIKYKRKSLNKVRGNPKRPFQKWILRIFNAEIPNPFMCHLTRLPVKCCLSHYYFTDSKTYAALYTVFLISRSRPCEPVGRRVHQWSSSS